MADEPLKKKPSHKTQSKSGSVLPWRRWDMILSTVVLNVLALAIPILILQLYDRVIPNQSYGTLGLMGIAVCLVLVLEASLRFSRGYVLSWLGMHFEHGASVGAFKHMVNATLNDLNKRGIGEHVENIESTTLLKEFLAGQGFLILMDLPFVFLFLGIIAYFSMKIALAAVTILSIFILIAWVLGLLLRKHLEEQLDVNDRRYNFIVEMLTNHHTLKALGLEDLLLRRFERLQTHCSNVNYKVYLYAAEARDLASIFSYIMFVGIVAVAALQVINEATTIGVMAASIVLTNRAMQPIQAAMGVWTRFQYFTIAKKRIEDHFSLTLEPPITHGMVKSIKGKLTLKGVSFQYAHDKPEILKNIDLVIQPGTTITIHGKNSVGKTTLMWLLMGNLHPERGTVLIDDEPIANYHYRDLRRQMAYIPPKGILFQGTIMENMTMYLGAAHVDDALSLSRQLGLDDWIRRLPLGYETKVGDQLFLLLPDGIHQRICLVRALINCPKILILDEANTSLDEDGDRLLRQIVRSLHGQVTIIFVTHRPSIQELADESYELVNGSLIPKTKLSLPGETRVQEVQSIQEVHETPPVQETPIIMDAEVETIEVAAVQKPKKQTRLTFRKKGKDKKEKTPEATHPDHPEIIGIDESLGIER